MEIKDLKARQGKVDLVAEVVSKDEVREFTKFGKTGRVCNVTIKDTSGETKLTLWNEDIDKINVGDKVHIQNGWVNEFRGQLQITKGKFGKVDVLEATGGEGSPVEEKKEEPAAEEGPSESETEEAIVEEKVE